MKNSLKRIFIGMVIAMAFILPLQLPVNADSSVLDNDIVAITKTPVSKKAITFKFLMAMMGVAASSVVIYVGLSVYNKLLKSQSANVVGLKNLRASDNFKDAMNVFLEKTDWD